MARGFQISSRRYISRGSAVVTGLPCTLACWFKSGNDSAGQAVIGIGNSSDNNTYIQLHLSGHLAGQNPIRAYIKGGGDVAYATTTANYALNTWQHACGVYINNSLRYAYLNGGNKGTDTGSNGTPTGLNTTTIGAVKGATVTNFLDGDVAEAAIWNVALTDEEVAALAKGFSPLLIRPANLKAYWPLIRRGASIDNIDLVGGYHLTDYNSPTTAPHCRIVRAAAPLVVPIEGAGPTTSIPVMMNHYRKLRTA